MAPAPIQRELIAMNANADVNANVPLKFVHHHDDDDDDDLPVSHSTNYTWEIHSIK